MSHTNVSVRPAGGTGAAARPHRTRAFLATLRSLKVVGSLLLCSVALIVVGAILWGTRKLGAAESVVLITVGFSVLVTLVLTCIQEGGRAQDNELVEKRLNSLEDLAAHTRRLAVACENSAGHASRTAESTGLLAAAAREQVDLNRSRDDEAKGQTTVDQTTVRANDSLQRANASLEHDTVSVFFKIASIRDKFPERFVEAEWEGRFGAEEIWRTAKQIVSGLTYRMLWNDETEFPPFHGVKVSRKPWRRKLSELCIQGLTHVKAAIEHYKGALRAVEEGTCGYGLSNIILSIML